MTGWRPRHPDRILGVAALVITGFLFAWTFTFRIVDWDALGMAFWPRVTLGAMALLAVHFILRGRLEKTRDPPALILRGFWIPIGGFAFIFAAAWLGFALASVIALTILTGVLAPRRRWRWAAAVVLGLTWTAVAWLLFAGILSVPLPRGIFG